MTVKDNINAVSIKVRDNEEMKEFLKDMGLTLDEEGFLLDENKNLLVDSDKRAIHYTNVTSVFPGSKFIVKKNDYDSVSHYFDNYIYSAK